MHPRDPFRRIALGLILLFCATFLGMMGTLLHGLWSGENLARESRRGAEALLAVERLRRGGDAGELPELPGREELERARAQRDRPAEQRALARYEQAALGTLLRVQKLRERQLRGQAVAGTLLALLGLGALGWLLVAARRRVVAPLEGLLESLDGKVAELETSREHLHGLLAALPTALVEVDAAGRIAWLNPAAEELCGPLPESARAADLPEVGTVRPLALPEGRALLQLGAADDEPEVQPRPLPTAYEGLTGREQEIFTEIARGHSNREIAEALFISEGTVKTHVNNMLRKLGLRDRVQLLLYAARHDLLPPEVGLLE